MVWDIINDLRCSDDRGRRHPMAVSHEFVRPLMVISKRSEEAIKGPYDSR